MDIADIVSLFFESIEKLLEVTIAVTSVTGRTGRDRNAHGKAECHGHSGGYPGVRHMMFLPFLHLGWHSHPVFNVILNV